MTTTTTPSLHFLSPTAGRRRCRLPRTRTSARWCEPEQHSKKSFLVRGFEPTAHLLTLPSIICNILPVIQLLTFQASEPGSHIANKYHLHFAQQFCSCLRFAFLCYVLSCQLEREQKHQDMHIMLELATEIHLPFKTCRYEIIFSLVLNI